MHSRIARSIGNPNLRPDLHPTLLNLMALQHLRRGHRVVGPNLGRAAGHVAGMVGLDAVTGMTSRVLGSVAGMVGFDFGSVPGLGGGGVDPTQNVGPTASSKFTSQAQKDAALAADQANIDQAQQSIDALQAVVDGLRAQVVNVPGGVDENGQAVDPNFQGMVDGFVKGINDATAQLHQAQTVRNTWQAQLAQDQATPVTPQGGGQMQPQPAPAPQPGPAPVVTPPASGMALWKKALLVLAAGAAGYVAYENI